MKKVIDNEIIIVSSASELRSKIKAMMAKGWVPVGSHHVVTVNETARIAGNQHKGTIYEHEYTQSMERTEINQTPPTERDDIKIPAWDTTRPPSKIKDFNLIDVICTL